MKRCMKALVLIAVVAFWSGPSGAEEATYRFELSPMVGGHIFEGNQSLDDGYTLGLTAGFPVNDRWTLEGGFTWISAETEMANIDVDGQRFSLDALFHFMPDNAMRPFVLIGGGALRLDPEVGDSETDVMAEYGAGIKYAVMPNLDLRAELRHVMPFDRSYNNLAWQLGLTWSFGKRHMAMHVMDGDGDGVPDHMDKCADTPTGVAIDHAGCPVMMDGDGDGIPDKMDICPDTPAGAMVDEGGCLLDSDSDGVPDHMDTCSDTPMGQAVDELGCPVVLDADRDGVADDQDRCPDTPLGAKSDPRGCWVIQGLSFDSGKTLIKVEYLPLLKEVVGVLKANPGTRVSIEGYTDSQGSKVGNQRISEARAKAVQDYLVSKGIGKERLDYKGFGAMNPVADNATADGRRMNRRVELRPM
ncbi:OmpA family protein [Desulfoluna sp.]|uniref:OmpA family protein n=1 Tax=Desulfoluna sp. TaxID=2045199 RepID=UPI00260871FF|nr:OmpA family protein [Desulfoluna sp.]